MKFQFFIIILFYVIIKCNFAFSRDVKTSYGVESLQSAFYPEGERHKLNVDILEEHWATEYSFQYNSTFGLNEIILNGKILSKVNSNLSLWGNFSLGKDAVASNQQGTQFGMSYQFLPSMSGNLEFGYRNYRNSDVILTTAGIDYETSLGLLFIPRLILSKTAFDAGAEGTTFSWFIKSAYLYGIIKPYVFYGYGKELDLNLGGLLTTTLRTKSYGVGSKLIIANKIHLDFSFEKRELVDLDRSYSFLSFSAGTNF